MTTTAAGRSLLSFLLSRMEAQSPPADLRNRDPEESSDLSSAAMRGDLRGELV